MFRQVIWIVKFSLLTMAALAPQGQAASAPEIYAGVCATLDKFFYKIPGARDLANRSIGMLGSELTAESQHIPIDLYRATWEMPGTRRLL